MKTLRFALAIVCVAGLTACGSILSSINVDTIADNPGERTLAQIIEDDNIETKVTVNIHAENKAYHHDHFAAVSYNGYVLLVGQVQTDALKSGATNVVRKVVEVRRIYNELEIGPPTSAATRTKDAWITTKVKSKLMGSEEIESGRVKVVTENGVVYLMGMLTRKEADFVAEKAADSGVKRVVKIFEIVE